MRTTLIAVVAATLSVGCQGPQVPDFRGDAQEAIEDARARAGELRDLSAEELREIWAIEYTSLEVAQADLSRVDELLNEMGQDRWDCYHVGDSGQGRVFYFKRNKTNAATYLTNLFRLGAVAF
jgi:hypothetical protein